MFEFSWQVKNASSPVETTIFFLLACFLPKTVAVRSLSVAPSSRSRSIDTKTDPAPDASRTRIDRSRPNTAPSHESSCDLRTRTARRSVDSDPASVLQPPSARRILCACLPAPYTRTPSRDEWSTSSQRLQHPRDRHGSNLNVVSGLDSKSDVSVGMNPSTGPRTRLERAGPRSGSARSQTWRSGCRVPGHTPSVSTRGVGSADYPPVRIFAAIGTSRGELEERRSHKPGETFSRPNPTLSTPVFVNLRGASRDLPDQRSEFPMRGACRDPTEIHCVEHLASAG